MNNICSNVCYWHSQCYTDSLMTPDRHEIFIYEQYSIKHKNIKNVYKINSMFLVLIQVCLFSWKKHLCLPYQIIKNDEIALLYKKHKLWHVRKLVELKLKYNEMIQLEVDSFFINLPIS